MPLFCLSLLLQARHQSALAEDMTKLRKVANAGMLYKETEGEVPYRLQTLVEQKTLRRSDLDLAGDPRSEGFYNYWELKYGTGPLLDVRQSVLDFGSMNAKGPWMSKLLGRGRPRWALAFLEPLEGSRFLDIPDHYFRIETDGSILHLATPIRTVPSPYAPGTYADQLTHYDMFSDPQ